MEARTLDVAGEKSWCIVFEIGDDPVEGLVGFAREHRVDAAHFTAIGAFREATLGFFDWERKEYDEIPVDEQVEVVALVGNVARAPDGSPKVHAHVVVTRRDGTAMGGHLLAAKVRPTLEVMLTESPSHLRRAYDPATGLVLIDPEAGK